MKRVLLSLVSLLAIGAASAEAQVCLYEHVYFGGAQACFGPGQRVDNLSGYFNDLASSVRIAPGYSVLVCEHAGFRGRCIELNADHPDFAQFGWNDIISSLEVRSGGGYPPPYPPPGGNPVKMVAQVNVGCKGRVDDVTLENFMLVQDSGGWMTFRASKTHQHKCGDVRSVITEASISLSRWDARVSRNGVLLAPAVNAQIQCDARTGWTAGPCLSANLTQ